MREICLNLKNSYFSIFEASKPAQSPSISTNLVLENYPSFGSKQVKPGFTTYQPQRQFNFEVSGTFVGASNLNQELGQKEMNYSFIENLIFFWKNLNSLKI